MGNPGIWRTNCTFIGGKKSVCRWTHTVKTCVVQGSAVLSWSRGVSCFCCELDYTVAFDSFFLPFGSIWQFSVWGPRDPPPASLCPVSSAVEQCSHDLRSPAHTCCFRPPCSEAVSVCWIKSKGPCCLGKPPPRVVIPPPQCPSASDCSPPASLVSIFSVRPKCLYALGLHSSSFHLFHSAYFLSFPVYSHDFNPFLPGFPVVSCLGGSAEWTPSMCPCTPLGGVNSLNSVLHWSCN